MTETTVNGDVESTRDTANTVAVVVSDLIAGRQPVTRDTDFFEVGGNSILGARLVASLRETFGVQVTIRDVFMARTVAGIAAAIERRLAAHPSSGRSSR